MKILFNLNAVWIPWAYRPFTVVAFRTGEGQTVEEALRAAVAKRGRLQVLKDVLIYALARLLCPVTGPLWIVGCGGPLVWVTPMLALRC